MLSVVLYRTFGKDEDFMFEFSGFVVRIFGFIPRLSTMDMSPEAVTCIAYSVT